MSLGGVLEDSEQCRHRVLICSLEVRWTQQMPRTERYRSLIPGADEWLLPYSPGLFHHLLVFFILNMFL